MSLRRLRPRFLFLLACLTAICDGFAVRNRKIHSVAAHTRRLSNALHASTTAGPRVADSELFQSANTKSFHPIKSATTKAGMIAFIVSMCIALPATLVPQHLLYRLKLISRVRQNKMALVTGEFCARWLLRLIPFCKVECTSHHDENPEPSIWVCNHSSALDVFILLAADKRLRGKHRRPMKIIYWQQLESNPVTKLLFRQCGFIPVQMAANKAGEANDYDVNSFKKMLKSVKQAFNEGFDIGILPEGQLNPTPELGLRPCFPGAFTLAKLSKRPIHMMALNGCHRLWHPRDDIGMTVTGRTIKARVYPNGRRYSSSDEFLETFQAVVGHFGTKGKDMPAQELQRWLEGTEYKNRSA